MSQATAMQAPLVQPRKTRANARNLGARRHDPPIWQHTDWPADRHSGHLRRSKLRDHNVRTRGAITLVLALGLAAMGSLFLGTVALHHTWNKRVERQLKLDRQIGVAALRVRDRCNAIETLNQTIEALRITSAATPPPLKFKIIAAINVAARLQDVWAAAIPAMGLPGVLTPPAWRRLPPDFHGQQTLKAQNEQIKLMGRNGGLTSGASIFRRRRMASDKWHAQWGTGPF